ncbi:MAG: class I SAM-dependent methyltransferase [Chloroflexota bacterium]|nr:class I SAM-dependent methyltransferase [Chloroflexota bacterium]
MTQNDRVRWVYSSQNEQELEERYDQWAEEYDTDLESDFGWISPQRTSEYVAKHVAKEGSVLDAGAGTGLVGECLHEMGFRNMTAMDLSLGMLEVARRKSIYEALDQMTMGETLDYSTDQFDASVIVGVFTQGHAPASSIDELVRVVKSGGHIVFSLRTDTYLENGFKDKMDSLESAGLWKLVEVSDAYHPLPKGEPEVMHQVWVFQVS